MTASPQLTAISGPLEGKTFDVDENGVRLSDDCIVRLVDGRVVVYAVRNGKEKARALLDHEAEFEAGAATFSLEHQEYDPNDVLGLYPNPSDAELESFFLGLLM